MDYRTLVNLYERVESTTKRLEKTYFLSEFLKGVELDDLSWIIPLLQGKVFAVIDSRKMGVATRIVIKSLSQATGISAEKIESEWKKTGDLGISAENLVKRKKQVTLFSQQLTAKKVFSNLQKLAILDGSGSVNKKVGLISELITSADPKEARYIVRTVLEDLRVGIGEGVMRDAIVWAFFESSIILNYDSETKSINPENRELYSAYVEAVQEAYDILNKFYEVAEVAKISGLKGLRSISVEVGKPVKVMLFPKVQNIEESFERVGCPAAFEYKYDGFRIQIHKKADKITVFTRRLEEVTNQFPEVMEYAKNYITDTDYILDCEAVGFDPKSEKYLPFQSISQRIKRKYAIEQTAKAFPIEINVFDVISWNNKSLLQTAFEQRRKIIEENVKTVTFKIRPARQLVTSSLESASEFYQKALEVGEEGVMVKSLTGIYKPGSRVGYGVKVKPVMESLDLVIVGAEWGEGKRSGWLTSFTLACFDSDTNEFLQIGKVGTGMKEKGEEGVRFDQLTEILKPHIIKESGRDVSIKPVTVIEVNFEEIQKSPTYSSGFALRFPRVIRLRPDRDPENCSDLLLVQDLFTTQRGRN